MTSFLSLFAALNSRKVQYLVAGGWAVNLYGVERATGDLDLVVWLEEHNLEAFIDVVTGMGLKPKAPVAALDFCSSEKRQSWIEEKGMMVFSFFAPDAPYVLLDVFITCPFDFAEVYEHKSEIPAGNVAIPVVPLETLIEMKRQAGRPQDLADLYYLKQLQEGELNG